MKDREITLNHKDLIKRIEIIESQVGDRDILVSDCCGGIVWEESPDCPVCHNVCTPITEQEFEG